MLGGANDSAGAPEGEAQQPALQKLQAIRIQGMEAPEAKVS